MSRALWGPLVKSPSPSGQGEAVRVPRMGLYRGCQPGGTSEGWGRGEAAQTCAVPAAAACWVAVEMADVE